MTMSPRGADRARDDEGDGSRRERGGAFHDRMLSALVKVVDLRRDVDGRILAAGALGVYFLVVAASRAFTSVDLWSAFGVPARPSPFIDARNVTAALECRRLGFDPLVENPCDPLGRPMNYPRVWLALRWLGLNQSHTDLLAIAFVALFLVSVFLLVRRISLGEGILLAVAMCSPSVMFAIERTNMDVVIFSLLVAAVLVWGIRPSWSEALSPLIVLLAATAKIYPAAALGAFLATRRRRAVMVAVLAGLAFLVYAAVTLDDIQAVARTAPQGQHRSFGARILPAELYHQFFPQRWASDLAKQLVAIVPLLVTAPLIWLWGRRCMPPSHAETGQPLLAFHFGALTFLGTFLTANNFDYRLIFLLLTLPQLFRWAAAGPGEPRRGLAGLTLVVTLVLLWVSAYSEALRLADEIVTWATVVLLVALLAGSVPRVGDLLRFDPQGVSTSIEG